MKVLIVDDDKNARIYLESLLQSNQFDTQIAVDGLEALYLGEKTRPDLVISDILMPNMDGYALLRSFKADSNLASIPFILYSATFTDQDSSKLALDLGADRFLIKPMEPDELLIEIQAVVEEAKSAAMQRQKTSEGKKVELLESYSSTISKKLDKKVEELKKKNEELIQSELKYRTLIEAFRDDHFFYIRNFKNEFSYISPSVKEVLTTSMAEGESILQQLLQEHGEDAATKQGKPEKRKFKHHYKDKNDVGRWLEFTEIPILDESGDFTEIEGVVHDISEHVALAEELKRAKERSEISGRAKDSFLAMMSHELRTPLNGILGMAGLMQEIPLTEEAREYASIIETSGLGLLRVIEDIMDISQIESGRLLLCKGNFILKATFNNLKELFRASANAKNIQLEYEMDANLPEELFGDCHKVGQILSNLIANAIKFTEKGKVTFRARLLEKEEESCLVRLEVEDTGIGIQPEKVPIVFKRFTQVEEVNTRQFGGIGLGLTIVEKLVDLMEGKVGVETEVGRGSCFWFDLTFTTPEFDSKHSPLIKTSEKLEMSPAERTVLIVEDEPVNISVLCGMLNQLGFLVEIATTGKEALSKLEKKDYPIIMMDYFMPEMDGFETSRQIRDREKNNGQEKKHTIIGVTASAMVGDKERGLASGMDDYLSKPFSIEELSTILKPWVGKK